MRKMGIDCRYPIARVNELFNTDEFTFTKNFKPDQGGDSL